MMWAGGKIRVLVGGSCSLLIAGSQWHVFVYQILSDHLLSENDRVQEVYSILSTLSDTHLKNRGRPKTGVIVGTET